MATWCTRVEGTFSHRRDSTADGNRCHRFWVFAWAENVSQSVGLTGNTDANLEIRLRKSLRESNAKSFGVNNLIQRDVDAIDHNGVEAQSQYVASERIRVEPTLRHRQFLPRYRRFSTQA